MLPRRGISRERVAFLRYPSEELRKGPTSFLYLSLCGTEREGDAFLLCPFEVLRDKKERERERERVSACACVREREREGKKEGERKRKSARAREREISLLPL